MASNRFLAIGLPRPGGYAVEAHARYLGQSGSQSSRRRSGLFMPLTLAEQECSNCRFSRRPAGFGADGRLSCRYLPPQPCDNNIWRLVPENFWCGKWEWGPQDPIPGKQVVPARQLQ